MCARQREPPIPQPCARQITHATPLNTTYRAARPHDPPPTPTQLIPVRAKSFPSPSRPCEEEASPPRRSSRDAPAVKLIHGRAAISSSIMYRARRPNDLYFLDAAKKIVSMLELIGTL